MSVVEMRDVGEQALRRRRRGGVVGRWAVGVSVGVNVFLAVGEGVVRPMYERGVGQGVGSWVNAAVSELRFPGEVLANVFLGCVAVPGWVKFWGVMFAFNVGVWGVVGAVVGVVGGWALGWGGEDVGDRVGHARNPHPDPLPEYRERGQEKREEYRERGKEKRWAVPTLREGEEGANDQVPMTNKAPNPNDRGGGGGEIAARGDGGISRRRFVGGLGGVVGAGVMGVGGYATVVEPRAFRVVRRVVPIADLPGGLEGLVVAQLTDIHHGKWMPLSHVREIVRVTNGIGADLILLTGDYVLGSAVYARPVVSALAGLRARCGVLAVLGNHDWEEDGPGIRGGLEGVGIPTLDNARMVLTPGRELVDWAGEGLAICGVGDLWRDRQLYEAALGGLPGGMPRLLMSHNPDVAEEPRFVEGGWRVDLMVCGHLHGGQVWLPGVGAPWAPSRFGDKYARGVVRGPTTRVFTSPGLGMTGLPVRLGARPEISVLELRRG